MRRVFALPLVLATVLVSACEADPKGDGDPGPGPTGDEAIFVAMLEGEVAAADGIAQVAASDGWPIETSTGFVFARLDGAGAPFSIAGDHNDFLADEMTLTNGFWWTRVAISFPDESKYKFVDGSASFQADPRSRRYAYDALGEISLVRSSAAHLERFFDVTDGVVAARTLHLSVPAGTPTHHLYVHDGQNLFDPGAPFGSWKLDEVLGSQTLAVGIDNTGARMDEYTHVPDDIGAGATGGDGDAYADFVHETVRPLIEAHYGTPARVGTMGSSLGGLISFHIALRHVGEYDFAASLSGTMGWGSITLNNETMIERQIAAGHLSTKLYLDSGGDAGSGCVDSDADGIDDDAPDASDNYCENRQLADALPGVGYVYDTDLWHWHEAGAAHDEAAWAARVFRPVDLFEAL